MKVPTRLISLFVAVSAALFLVLPIVSFAEEAPQWLFGRWEGISPSWANETRTLEIRKISSDKEPVTFTANYGITGKKLDPVVVTLAQNKITFMTSAKSTIALERTSEIRMKGTFSPKDSDITTKPLEITFWKDAPVSDSNIRDYIGVWEGLWQQNSLPCRITIRYADSNVFAFHYKCGDVPEQNIRGGSMWREAKLSSGDLRWEDKQNIKRFSLTKDKKRLKGEIIDYGASNWIWNTIYMDKKAEFNAPTPIPKKIAGKINIENGFICFPEDDAPDVNIREDIEFSLSPDSPAEIRGIQGKIYGGRASGKAPMVYLIPMGYDARTRTIKMLYISDNKGTQYKPTKAVIAGIYDGSEGSALKYVTDKSDKPWVRSYIIPNEQGYKIRFLFHSGSDVYFLPVAELSGLMAK